MNAAATRIGTLAANGSGGASAIRPLTREWSMASWPVRLAVLCLALFYLFAGASPWFAPYDPTLQYRELGLGQAFYGSDLLEDFPYMEAVGGFGR